MKKMVLIAVCICGAIFMVGGCASIPPTVQSEKQKIYYISPKNGDGVQDTLSLPMTIEAAKRHVIKGYRIRVSDDRGNLVKEESAEAAELKFWKKLGTALGFVKKEGVDIPEVLLWDGRDDKQMFVPDGRYEVTVSAWDDKKRTVTAEPVPVVVDNTPPKLSLSIPYRIFSPNGDGNKEVLPVTQSGSEEDLWTGVFSDPSGKDVRHLSWEGVPAERIEWDGKDDGGVSVADGIYSYVVSSVDRAGNKGGDRIEYIGINTKPSVISISSNYPAFSPNGDGIQDTLTLIPVFPSEGVDGWNLVLSYKGGTGFRRLQGVEQFSFNWDGTDEHARMMPDGEYFFEFDVLYENGNNPRITLGPVLLDTLYPSVKTSADYTLFSPEGDGRKDTISILHRDATPEEMWKGELLSPAGKVLLSHTWRGTPPDITWDGRNEAGEIMHDGAYIYRVSSTDSAGNGFVSIVPDIMIDTRSTPLQLSLSGDAFSPNNDSVRDTMMIIPRPGITEGIEKWKIVIIDSSGRKVKSAEGDSPLSAYVWNGLMDNGVYARDGEYTARMELTYRKGNNPSAVSDRFILDTVFPSAQLSAEYLLFSPDGDGSLDTINLRASHASSEEKWTGEVVDRNGGTVRQISWKNIPGDFIWDGKDEQGKTVSDGGYVYRLFSEDRAGNTFQTELKGIRIDTRPTPLSLEVDRQAFSPNGDGESDTLMVMPQVGLAEGIVGWEVKIKDGEGATVFSRKRTGKVSAFMWDGETTGGIRAPDGEYRADFEVLYANGKNPRTTSSPFYIDTLAPEADVSSGCRIFSPDGDTRKDVFPISQRTSREQLWTGVILNAAGSQIRQYRWKDKAPDFSWDGMDGSGNPVADGEYAYMVYSIDPAGNTGRAKLEGISVDTRPTPVRLVCNSSGFSPNGDGFKDTISFGIYTGLSEGIFSWNITAIGKSPSAHAVIASGKGGTVPNSLSWNGKVGDGGPAREGVYRARLTVEYEKGNLAEHESEDFVLDITPPKVSLSASPLPFSPDDDGINDTVTIGMSAEDASPLESWSLQLLDPMSNIFNEYSAQGAPERSISWNGKSLTGELVQAASDYTLFFRVRDYYGNIGSAKSQLPVDVYVLREGDRFKIQISSIYFAPFSADFQPGKEEEGMRTLRRLAEILKKFPDYQISIEGHAVRIYWFDEAKGKTEEQKELGPLSLVRAERVKEILSTLGIKRERMSCIGFGGKRPIVSHSDLDNRWKNRRVEFILKRD